VTGSAIGIKNLLSLGDKTVLVLMFCAYFLVLEAILLSLARRSAYRSKLRRRLAMSSGPEEQQLALARMRQKPLSLPSVLQVLPLGWLNRLILQSGVTWGGAAFPTILLGVSTLMALPLLYLSGNLAIAVAGGFVGGTWAVLLCLKSMRDRRYRKLEAQLPDAADVLVRSLKAGHPIVSSIRLVARELPDPIGTEFAIVADEMTYGLDLETAMNNLGVRVGQQDFALIVIATSIQSSAGGNLAEIMGNMSRVVRERLKLRLKVKSLSSEGRLSAIVLSVIPFALFGLIAVIAPNFYGEILGEPKVQIILVASAMWLVLGDFIMFRMIRFEI
jgi:tight adherence protein B